MTDMTTHTPLQDLSPGPVQTAGRLRAQDGEWFLTNAHANVAIRGAPNDLDTASLYRLSGQYDGRVIDVESLERIHSARATAPEIASDREMTLAEAVALRAAAEQSTRELFTSRGFTHVSTPRRVTEPGTDVHLEPLELASDGAQTFLHTSPEFAMKELLCAGFERIWQTAHVWRGGEQTPLHHPEFTIVEWYRAWEELDTTIDDTEALVGTVVGDTARIGIDGGTVEVDLDPPFEHMTMQDVVEQACGFDILQALDHASLLEAAGDHGLLSNMRLERAADHGRWDELFFELQVSHIDPYLAERGAVCVTEWPAPLAVLARRKPADARVAERFELYVGGIEIANGFRELTDPDEQRARFEQDNRTRRELGLEPLPMPETFLSALEYGLPESSGVAVGFDRLLMLASGAGHIREVVPYAQR